MSALSFQIHVDKENTGSLGINSKHRHGSTSGIRVKTFQENSTPGLLKPRKGLGDLNTPASARPRKALGDINGTTPSVLKANSGGLKPLSINVQCMKKPDIKKSQEKNIKKQEPRIVAIPKAAPVTVAPIQECDEIEHMYNERDPDSDEEIWPARERISTYIDRLISWRPPCLFGQGSASDDEEDDRRIQEIMQQLDDLPLPNTHVDDDICPQIEPVPEPRPEDDIPFADITIPELCSDLPVSALEDSYSTVPTLGTLTLKDDI